MQTLVQKGIPKALRCEVWSYLSGSFQDEDEMINVYHSLLVKESPDNKIIINDVNRTFPAHEYFKEQGGIGQEALYNLSRVCRKILIVLFSNIFLCFCFCFVKRLIQ